MGLFSIEQRIGLLIGAALHDYRHDGLNNQWHCKVGTDLAIRYNDRSPLESMHLSESFVLMNSDGGLYNPFYSMPAAQTRPIREVIIHCVIGTDISYHFTGLKGSWMWVASLRHHTHTHD